MRRAGLGMVLGLAGVAWAGLAPAPAEAQSYNCRNARLPAEVAICNDGQLSSLDEDMASLYFRIRNTAPGWIRSAVTAEQRGWLADRNRCGYDGQCILGSYRWRIQQLYEWSERY